MKQTNTAFATLAIGLITFSSCKKDNIIESSNAASSNLSGVQASTEGVVYTMDNATAGNNVWVFRRAANGALTSVGSFATGGTGTGAGLGSQGAIVQSGHRLF